MQNNTIEKISKNNFINFFYPIEMIDLKKHFFVKELQAGEIAIIQYTNLSVAL